MATPLIEFSSVTKSFGARVVLRDLSLSVARGETLTILGASGSGKSVMLKLLIGLERADGGSIRAFGEEVIGLGEEALAPLRRRVSMMFQGGALFDSLSAAENVAYPLRLRKVVDEALIAERVRTVLALVGLPGIEELAPASLSGGMRKRLALARAIVAEPDVVLYDEPTTGLDPVNSRRIVDLIRSIQSRLGITSLVVTHDMAAAFLVADRMAMISDGVVLAALPTEEFRKSEQPAIHEFISAMSASPRRPS